MRSKHDRKYEDTIKKLQEENKHYYVHTCGKDFVIDEINADVTFSGTKKECEQFVLNTEKDKEIHNLKVEKNHLVSEKEKRNAELKIQLIKAKELINRVVEWADADHPKEYFEWIVKDLKQFLKE